MTYAPSTRSAENPDKGTLTVLATQLRAIASSLEQSSEPPPHITPAQSPRPVADVAGLARMIYALRRARNAAFGSEDMFGEPGWDMLLDLFVSEHEGKRLPVTSACIGAAVPTTTGLRWLNILEKQGLVVRENDPHDARRTYIRISPKGDAAMLDLLQHFAAHLSGETPLA